MDLPKTDGRLSWAVIWTGSAIELAIGIAGFAVGWMLNKENLLETLALGLAPGKVGLGALLGLAAALILSFAVRMIKFLQRSRSMRVLEVLRSATWLQAILLCALAACAEEILFRGALQPDLGIWATAVLFGLLHAYGKLYVAVAMLAGVGLGFLYQLTGSLPAAITAHGLYNLTIMVIVKTKGFPISRQQNTEQASSVVGL